MRCMAQSLPQRVADTIARLALVEPEQTIIVALSGGADSVALLRALHCLGYKLEAVHCNFSLRGEDSDGDEAFVRNLCASLSIPLMVERFKTERYARKNGLSIEMAAREQRYDLFSWLLRERSEALVAVGHNADDQVETMLLNLSMGTGIRGLSGMPYKRHDGIVRPLMDCTRAEIVAYLSEIGQAHREDRTNAELIYRRNHVRHRLMPVFKELNPSFLRGALRTIEHLRGVETIYLDAIERLKKSVMPSRSTINIPALLATPHPEALLYEIISPLGFTSDQAHDIASLLPMWPSGRRYESGRYYDRDSWVLVRSFDVLEIVCNNDWADPEDWKCDYSIKPRGWGSEDLPAGRMRWRSQVYKPGDDLKCAPNEALFDADVLLACSMWSIRSREEGDTLSPYGMSGRKKVKRILIERKFTYKERKDACLLCADGVPIWLIGHVADRRYGVGVNTKVILRFTFEAWD